MAFIAGSLDGLNGPPTPFALRMRPWLIFVFGSLGLVGLARLALLDVTGGLFLELGSHTLLFMPPVKMTRGAGFLVEASQGPPTSFSGHGHAPAPSSPAEALEQAKAGFKTCMLGFMASSAALLSAYVTWSLEKEHFEHEVHEHHQRHGARH
eukprot:g19762.t1